MTAANELRAAAALHDLRERAPELAAENERLRVALQEITEVFCNAPEQKNDVLAAIAFAGAFSRCQAIAERALAGEKGEEG